MKCLSVLQPWASLLLSGAKHFETRSWRTDYRGPLAIHAGRKFPDEARRLCLQEPFRSALRRAGFGSPADLPLGKVLGRVELTDCLYTKELLPDLLAACRQEIPFGDYRPGRWAWLCLHPVGLAVPFPWRGKIRFFEVPDDLLRDALIPKPTLFTNHQPP